MASCLMGLLLVNMPLLYGEGGLQAFHRLQQEVMRVSNDQSLFVWGSRKPELLKISSAFADFPRDFASCGAITSYKSYESDLSYTLHFDKCRNINSAASTERLAKFSG